MKNGPEIIDFRPVLELLAAFLNRRMFQITRNIADLARAAG
jgi:hypothetical protein